MSGVQIVEMRHLRSLVALAETGSFTGGAKRMRVVQSTFSATIKELEAELGFSIVERTTRRVEINRSGKLLLQHARATISSLENGLQAVRGLNGIVRGKLKISLLQSLEPYVSIPSVLQRFRVTYPEVELEVQTYNDTGQIPNLIRSGTLDLGFYPMIDAKKMPELEYRGLVDDALVVIVPHSHPFQSLHKLSLDDLEQESFVDLTEERKLRVLVDRLFATHRLKRWTAFEINDEPTAVQFVEAGLGISILPSALARMYAVYRRIAVIPIVGAKTKPARWLVSIVRRLPRTDEGQHSLSEVFIRAIDSGLTGAGCY